MRSSQHNGFTLLELVISCAIVVSIFALATTALTRVHRLRAESESQTRLMTEGRALLDDLANQLAHVADTNIWLTEYNADDKDGKLTLALIRYAVHPHSRQNGDAYADTPYYSTRFDFASGTSRNPTSSVERIARSSIPGDQLLHSNVNMVTYNTAKRDSFTVTNAYSAEEMGTHIPAAAAGDTIRVPVTYGSSATTYGTRTSLDAHITSLPSLFEGTNTVFADITFKSDHSGENTLTIRKPVIGRWPPPSTRIARITATAEIDAENLTTNFFMSPGYLDYTNVPLAVASFPIDETNATARTTLLASIAAYDSIPQPAYSNTNDLPASVTNDIPASVTNDVPASVTNDVPASVTNDVPASVTNDVPASVTNDIPVSVTNGVPASVTNDVPVSVTNGVPTSVTNDIPVVSTNTNDVVVVSTNTIDSLVADMNTPSATNDMGSVTYPDTPYVSSTNGLVSGELLYGPYDSPLIVSNYWSWGESAPIDTNGIISGVSIVVNGRTNTYASAADVAAAATSTVTYAAANFQFSEMLDLLTVDLDAGTGAFGALSNVVSGLGPVSFTNEFAPKDTAGGALPVFVSEILSYEERLAPQDFATAFSAQSTVAATGPNATPLASQEYKRQMELVIVREVTTNGMTIRVGHNWNTQTRYQLLFDVEESLVPTNSWHYGGAETNTYPNGTSYDSETRWVDIVPEEDFEGADERTAGIWLREENERDLTELVVKTNSVKVPYSLPRNADSGVSVKTLAPAIWGSIQNVVITPLCFSTNENRRLDLMVWNPNDDPPGPPVCADIYLELLSPLHQRRANKITDDERRDLYIQNHVIRISRRAPIGTARKMLP